MGFNWVFKGLSHHFVAGQLFPCACCRRIVNSYTESGRKIHLCVVRGEICEPVSEFRPEICNSCSLFDSVRGHAFCKLGKCVKSFFEPQIPTPEVYHQKIWCGQADFELSYLCLAAFGGRSEILGGPRVEDTWSVRFWGSTPFGSPVVTMRTTRFNIQQFYVLPTQCIYDLYGSENKQRIKPYRALADSFYKRYLTL